MALVRLVAWEDIKYHYELRIIGYTRTIKHMFYTETVIGSADSTIAEFTPKANTLHSNLKVIIATTEIPSDMPNDGIIYLYASDVFKPLNKTSYIKNFMNGFALGLVLSIISSIVYIRNK